MIISLHLPKTAGSSFSKSLENYFQNFFRKDYFDQPISKSAYERNKDAIISSLTIAEKGISGIKCIHGHFLPIKYLLLNSKHKLTFITWMRNPVDRIVSHYYYFQKIKNIDDPPAHLKKVIDEKWSLERFCLGPEFRNLYCQYLWGFPIEMFDFIGIVEHYEDELSYFANTYLKTKLDPYKINTADNKKQISSNLRKDIECYHSRDVFLYRRALQIRHERLDQKKT